MSRTPVGASVPKKRTPINGRNVLTVTGKEPGYVYRIVNDRGDRIAQFIEAGYELVEAKDVKVGDNRINAPTAEGSKAQVSVDREGSKAFVMRIKQEYYDEDQKAKQEHVNRLEQSIKQPGNADYGKISITTGNP